VSNTTRWTAREIGLGRFRDLGIQGHEVGDRRMRASRNRKKYCITGLQLGCKSRILEEKRLVKGDCAAKFSFPNRRGASGQLLWRLRGMTQLDTVIGEMAGRCGMSIRSPHQKASPATYRRAMSDRFSSPAEKTLLLYMTLSVTLDALIHSFQPSNSTYIRFILPNVPYRISEKSYLGIKVRLNICGE
jgi:hypothetical protein